MEEEEQKENILSTKQITQVAKSPFELVPLKSHERANCIKQVNIKLIFKKIFNFYFFSNFDFKLIFIYIIKKKL